MRWQPPRFRYAGEYWDSESGLIYLRARYYDSGVGGFISEDPARDGENQTWDNEVDAYRHFTWNALMVRELGFGEAAMVANTHELMEQDRNGLIDTDSIGFVQGSIRTKMNQPTLMDL